MFRFLTGSPAKPKTGNIAPKLYIPNNSFSSPGQDVKLPPVAPIVEKQVQPEVQSLSYDLDKLAHAVAFAETGGCKDGTARKRNNCFGIMHWPNGKRTPKWYSTKEESFADFKRIWKKSYKRFPDLALARKWTGNDHPERWLKAVKQYYFSH